MMEPRTGLRGVERPLDLSVGHFRQYLRNDHSQARRAYQPSETENAEGAYSV